MKISTKVTIIILFFIAVAVAVSVFFTFVSIRSALQQSIGESQQQLARQTMDKIDRLLYERYADVQFYAGRGQLKNFLTGAKEERAAAREELRNQFNALKAIHGIWDEISLLDVNGTRIVSTAEEAVGTQISLANEVVSRLFHRALKGEVLYSDLLVYQDAEGPVMLFMAPVRTEERGYTPEIIGVLEARLAWPVVLEILESVRGLSVYLLNGQGVEIGSNDSRRKSAILVKNYLDQPLIMSRIVEQRKLSEILPDLQTGFDSLTSHVSEAGHLGYKGNGWALILQAPANEVFVSARRLAATLAAFLVIIIFSGVLLSLYVIKRQVFNPLHALIKGVNAIRGGDLSQRLAVSSHDEIGEVAGAFNEMTISIEERVKERTAELDRAKQQLEQKVGELERTNKFMVGRELKMVELKEEIAEMKKKLGQG